MVTKDLKKKVSVVIDETSGSVTSKSKGVSRIFLDDGHSGNTLIQRPVEVLKGSEVAIKSSVAFQ